MIEIAPPRELQFSYNNEIEVNIKKDQSGMREEYQYF
jgi:hypothetical protein